MNCTFCGKALNVHVLDPGDGGWQDRLYCSACRAFQQLPGDTSCLYCSGTYRHFLATGRLGCAHCYDAFAADLEPLVEQYRGRAHSGSDSEVSRQTIAYAPDRLARARSEEIVRLVREADGAGEAASGQTEAGPAGASTAPGIRSSGMDQNGADAVSDAGTNASGESTVDPGVVYRIRVARNITGLPYRLTGAGRNMLDQVLLSPGSSLGVHIPGGLAPVIAGAELRVLQAAGTLPAGARAAAAGRSIPSPDSETAEAFWAYTGDEDHLRIQWRGNTRLASLEDLAPRFDTILNEIARIDALFAFQYHPEYGFLTACPGIGGAGIRVSFLISVRNLVSTGVWSEYYRRLQESGLEVRGSRGEEGGESIESDGFAQISNRFWPAGLDYGAAIRRMLLIVRRIGAANFQENRMDR